MWRELNAIELWCRLTRALYIDSTIFKQHPVETDLPILCRIKMFVLVVKHQNHPENATVLGIPQE